jgi:HEAT repeat protein
MNKAIMSVAALLCVLVVLCAGCPGEKSGPGEDFKKKTAEAGSQKELADFFLEEESYVEAGKHYEETVRIAHIALSYCRDDEGMSRLIKEAEAKLESEEIVEGCQGKIVVKGQWVKPDEYLAERVRVISASPDYEKTSAVLKKEFETLLEVVGNTPERALETDSGKKIIAEGMKALPVLLERVDTGDFFSETAAHLVLNIPDADDTILCFLLTGLKSHNQYVRKACALSAWKFPRKVTTVVLAEGLSHISSEVCEAFVVSIIKLNAPLGWHVFREIVLVLVLAATSSLLKLDSEKIPPALATVLKRAKDLTYRAYQNEELFTALIEKLGEVRYADAVDALAEVFYEPSFPMAMREAAMDALAGIGDEAALEHLSRMVHYWEDEHGELWITAADKLADAVKRLKNKDILNKFIKDTESSHAEVVARAAYVLGLFEDETALPHLREAFRDVENKKTRSAILNALARIGNNAAIEEILLIFKTGDVHEIVDNYVDGIQENIQHEPAFHTLFKGLEDCPPTVTKRVFESVRAGVPPLALEALFLIAADRNLPFELRFGAISALSSYVEQMTENQKGRLRDSILVGLALLDNERDPDLFVKLASEALRYHKDQKLLPLYVKILKQSDNWLMRYLATRCLLAIVPEISPAIILSYRKEIAEEYRQLRESKEYGIAELLAGFASNRNEEIAEIRTSRNEEIAELVDPEKHPLKGRLGQPLARILELLGKNCTKISLPQSASEDSQPSQKPKFLHFTDDAILLMVSKGSQEEEKVTAAVYLPDFKGKLYGISVGQNINSVFRLLDLENPEQIRYLPEYGAYVIVINPSAEGDPKKPLRKMLVLPLEETGNGGAVIRYMVEILSRAGEEQELDTLVKVIGELTAERPGPETVP